MPKTAQKDASVATVKKQGAVMKHIKKYWQWYAMMFIPIVYQVDLREELGYACGNFMYGGNTELLTSNFTDDLRDFYDRQGQYRKLRPLDPTVTFDEDQMEMLNLWGTPMTDTVNAWTCKFAMNQADINNDWDTYVAEVEAQNMQNIVDMYNDTYNASK